MRPFLFIVLINHSPLPPLMARYLNSATHRWHHWCYATDPGGFQGRRKHSREQSSGKSARYDQNLRSVQSTWPLDGRSATERDLYSTSKQSVRVLIDEGQWMLLFYLEGHDQVGEMKLCFQIQLDKHFGLSWWKEDTERAIKHIHTKTCEWYTID